MGHPVLESKRERDEREFVNWYKGHAAILGLDPNPDSPLHFYDWRAAWRAGAAPDQEGHWPSTFKLVGHPALIVDGVDTRTMKAADAALIQQSERIRNKVMRQLGLNNGGLQ